MAGTNAAHSVDSSSSFFLTEPWFCSESKLSDQREWSVICLGVSMWNLGGSLLEIQRRIFLLIKSMSQPPVSPSHRGNQISDGKLMVKANKEQPKPWALMLGRRGAQARVSGPEAERLWSQSQAYQTQDYWPAPVPATRCAPIVSNIKLFTSPWTCCCLPPCLRACSLLCLECSAPCLVNFNLINITLSFLRSKRHISAPCSDADDFSSVDTNR